MTLENFCLKNKPTITDVDSTDYLYLVIASIISSCGFILNSETIVVGSMLISPLLKPVLNFVDAISTWNIDKHISHSFLLHLFHYYLLLYFLCLQNI